MNELFLHIGTILQSGDTLTVFGWMFGISLILGAMLDNNGKDLRDWAIAVTGFAVFITVAAFQFMQDQTDFKHFDLVMIFFVMSAIIYIGGLAGGWGLVYWVHKSEAKKRNHVR